MTGEQRWHVQCTQYPCEDLLSIPYRGQEGDFAESGQGQEAFKEPFDKQSPLAALVAILAFARPGFGWHV